MSKATRDGLKKYTLFLCLGFILSMSCLGIGWGMWTDSLNIEGTVTMGSMVPKVILKNPRVVGGHNHGDIYINNQELEVSITNADNDDVFFIDYEIRNDGTVPFYYVINKEVQEINGSSPEININPINGLVSSDSKTGTIIISKGDSKTKNAYNLIIRFNFTQWNVSP